jgi:hypothetical protein
MKRMIGLTAVLAIAGLGCGDDDSDGTTIELDFGPPEEDGGIDPGDTGPPPDMPMTDECVVGEACTMVRGCRTANAVCFEPSTFEGMGPVGIGGTDDPILNHPDGDETFVETPLFPGGYCTTSWPQAMATPTQCNLRGTEEVDPVCGSCATCIDIFGLDTADNTATEVPGFCARNCEPSLDSNECREGYDCLLTQEVCFLGCQSDDECRVAREDNNGVEGIQTPADCDDDATACTPADCAVMDLDACLDPASNADEERDTNGITGIQSQADCVADPSVCTPDDCGDATPADQDACDNPEDNFDDLDNNGVDGIQTDEDCTDDPTACTPADCATVADLDACDNPGENFDNLVYDTESAAICDPATSRCTGAPSDPDASGGDPCTVDSECEAEGFCIAEDPDDGSWAGGSCTKFRCDIAGNECANDGVCQEAGVGVFACFEGCTVGGYDTTSEPSTWVVDGSAQDTCRDGYGCFWGGTAAGGTADNGVCLPIEYSEAVTEPNIGAACTEDSDCFSPFGNGFCITGDAFPEGYCSVRNCAAPWFTEGTPEDQNVCGGDDLCVSFDMDDPTFALCLQDCSTADDCTDGLGCIELSAGGPTACFNCQTDAECRDGERCSMTQGLCVPE